MTHSPGVIGIGSNNGDDVAGWIVIERLHELGWSGSSARIARHPAELLDWCDPTEALIVCDACMGPGNARVPHHFTWPTEALPASPPRGSHELSMSFVLELGRTLGRIPESVSVWAIEGQHWLPDNPPSPTVQAAARLVADAIHASISHASSIAQH